MKALFFLFFISLISLTTYGQVLTGNIIDAQDQYNMKGVKVQNLRTAESFTSNDRGYFRMEVLMGDSVTFSKEGYVTHLIIVEDIDHVIIPLTFDAVGLPAAYVYADRPSMYIPGISLDRDPDRKPMGPGRVMPGHSRSHTDLTPGLTLDGPISYFTKRERNKRQYKRALEKLNRQAPYLEVIQSDSIKQVLMNRFELLEVELDELIIGFNIYHRDHEFLDMDHDTVLGLLYEFLNENVRRRREY
ncbi:hypothetical protein [Anditalea andensis]|uniref:Uncharacterized protein n=1 Tax=Anditalea andensis TaxID=1048983 RepID=A0A074L2V6_9BACT|nr:hypothetical protein [Anditalea andensis]KEO75519.1 hypothetical protein EL17_01335 [Anditalea andensis]